MTDFLGNLILRSTGEQSPHTLLQPRLPSLFEPVDGRTQSPSLPPEPIVLEDAAPASDQTRTPSSVAMSITNPTAAGDVLERKQSLPPRQHRDPSVPEIPIRSPFLEIKGEIVPPVKRSHTISAYKEEPERTIQPRLSRQTEVNLSSEIEHPPFIVPERRMKPLPVESLSHETEITGRLDHPGKPGKDLIQVVVKPLPQDPIFDEPLRAKMEEAAVQSVSKPSPVLQPMPMQSQQVSIRQFEPAQAETTQKIVEIHIGRIEVRAAPAPAPVKRAPQKMTMSLEEYLRKRPGERE